MLQRLFWWVPFGRVPEISAGELHVHLSKETAPYLLDVRTPGEWTTRRIPGAVNVPVTMLRSELARLDIDVRQPVVAICLSAHRSIPAVRLLRAAGFAEVRQLQGGMRAWWKAGLPIAEGPD